MYARTRNATSSRRLRHSSRHPNPNYTKETSISDDASWFFVRHKSSAAPPTVLRSIHLQPTLLHTQRPPDASSKRKGCPLNKGRQELLRVGLRFARVPGKLIPCTHRQEPSPVGQAASKYFQRHCFSLLHHSLD